MFFGPIGKTRWPPWPLIGWDIFDFSSETAERNSTKLDGKQDFNVLYRVCVFRANRKNNMAALASDWLRHFRLLLWNRWTKFNETWQEARSQRPLPRLCFSGGSEKQHYCPGLWLAETFSTSSLKLLNGIQWSLTGSKISMSSTKFLSFRVDRKNNKAALASDWLRHFRLLIWNRSNEIQRNLTGSKILTSSTEFVFFGPIGKTRWPPWFLIGWDIFDFSSETAERNSTKLDGKQDFNVLYRVFVFRANRKNNMAALASDWLRHFRLLHWNRWTEFNETWLEARSQRPLRSCVFWADWKNNMAVLASEWPRHFQLLLWNCWTEFSETWQECPLRSLCFLGSSENKNGRPGWFLKKVSHCAQMHDMWPFGPLVLCRLRSIAAHRDHSVRRLSVCPVVTLSW